MFHQKTLALLDRYAAGQASPEERRRVDRCVAHSPELKRALRLAFALRWLYHPEERPAAKRAASS